MERKGMKKVVYKDGDETKVIRGDVSEDDFVYQVKVDWSDDPIIIGKQAIVKITPLRCT